MAKQSADATATANGAVASGRHPGADRFFQILLDEKQWTEIQSQAHLRKWCEAKGYKHRSACDWLTKEPKGFRNVSMLVEFLNDNTHGGFKVSDLLDSGPKNYIQHFVDQNSTTDGYLEQYIGEWGVLRPGANAVFPFKKIPWDDASIQALEIFRHGSRRPYSFRHGTPDGWEGYVVAHAPLLYLVGLCTEGRDACMLFLRPYPEARFGRDILVGMQALVLDVPKDTGLKHAVSRRLAMIRRVDGKLSDELIGVATAWIDDAIISDVPVEMSLEAKKEGVDLNRNAGLIVPLMDRKFSKD